MTPSAVETAALPPHLRTRHYHYYDLLLGAFPSSRKAPLLLRPTYTWLL